MHSIRVISVPQLKVVNSGPITNMEELVAFDQWWSTIDAKKYITPRDFMWYNEEKKHMEWIFAIPEECNDFGGYEVMEFPGGLYAVATSVDTDADCNVVREEIKRWVEESGCFEISTKKNDTSIRYAMSHVITPKIFKEKMGYHLSDNFVPIVLK